MSRPKRIRRIENLPHYKGFMPVGLTEESLPVVMTLDEYESIRLSDFELLGQVEAANIMGVSRPTFARIYENARRKVARAFMLASPIVFEGGKVYFNSEWYSCNSCSCWFNHPEKDQEIKNCPLCGSGEIMQYKEDIEGTEDIYICSECGRKKKYTGRTSHRKDICPECNVPMKKYPENCKTTIKNM